MRRVRYVLVMTLMATSLAGRGQFNAEASQALIQRIIPDRAAEFIVQPLKSINDSFEIESLRGKIILRGNSPVSVASALYYYLTEYCHCQVTWNGINLSLPAVLPVVKEKVQKSSPYRYRYYLNYCTFNYTMSWWDWKRWEQEIDWMALHGINMPLAITGEEYTWHEVYREMGFTDEELQDFFCGPAYFAWFWMGNLDGWGGPLPASWMVSHRDLQQKILKRERELGMKPVLPAFTGHVPAAFKSRFPQAKLKRTNWKNGFGDTYILDSRDSLFADIGRRFLQKQTAFFGTDHLYSADTFNENEPPSSDSSFLSDLSARVFAGMKEADSLATWVMQGWLFYNDRKFWKAPQVQALLNAVPDDHMILLDLAAEIEPVWKRTEAFYGKPWIWCMLNNFGGNVNLFGRMEGVAAGPAEALHDKGSWRMSGIGLTMEATEQNPVIYELMMQHSWQSQPVDLDDWLRKYARNRYGTQSEGLVQAWQILRRTAYNGREIRDGAESILTGRPTLDSETVWTATHLNYSAKNLIPAWDLFIRAAKGGIHTDGFSFDLVDVTRQVLANYASPLQKKWVSAYLAKDASSFDKYSVQFLQLLRDMDTLLGTRKELLLGRWLASARSFGINLSESNLYEKNARDLITLWGDANNPLHEYANRQWSGLLTNFYLPRWEQFFQRLSHSMQPSSQVDTTGFDKDIRGWEWQWVNLHNSFPQESRGNSIEIALRLYEKYRPLVEAAYD